MRWCMTPVLFAAMLALGCNQAATDAQVAEQEVPTSVTTAEPAGVDTAEESAHAMTREAACLLMPVGDSGVSGFVRFTKEGDKIKVHGTVTGLKPGKHGFHVHEYGDLSDPDQGKSAGGHYNPTDQPHGKRTDEERHVGDFGNIEANEEGKATIDFEDSMIRLNGPHSIIGRALVVHAEADQFTQPSGDAGDRVALGVIGRANPESH